MSHYQVVVFDWDGTLMDSTRDIVRAMQAASVDVGLTVPDDRQASWVIGLSLDQALMHAVPDLTEEKRPEFLERYRFHYLKRDPALVLFEGVLPMLQALKDRGVELAVATGKSRVGLNRALAATGLAPYFSVTRCADETFGKPHPGMLLEIMSELGARPDSLVMVGDTSHDLSMAANAGVHGLGVSYGAHPEEELRQHPHQAVLADILSVEQWLAPRTRGWTGPEV
jgi:phosphoglycolate phosphatase